MINIFQRVGNDGISQILHIENHPLRDLKLGNLNDTSDFGAAFIAF
jgi:hypothetical protein